MEQVQHILADKIIEPIVPMRDAMDRDKLDALASSIKSEGLINPLTVRPVGDKFEIVAGHRRFKACLIAGVINIPCVVIELDDKKTFAIRAAENLFRSDLDPIEEAISLAQYIGEDETKIPEAANLVHQSVQWVEDRLNILTYPEYLIAGIKLGKISLGVAKWLGRIEDEVYRKMFCEQAINHGLAIWQAETYYRQWEAGVFKNSSEIIPAADDLERPAPAKVRTTCARCTLLAEEPNLQNVFIHRECPPESVPSPTV